MLRSDLLTFSDEQLRFFDGYFSRLIQERAPDRGDDTYYTIRIKQRLGALMYYDEAIVKWVTSKWPAEARPDVVHAGSGMGFLDAMLAINGCNVLGLDYYQLSAEAAQAVKEALVGLVPEVADRLRIELAGYPEGVTAAGSIRTGSATIRRSGRRRSNVTAVPSITTGAAPARRDRLLVFTNVGAGWDRERFERVVASFVDYQYVILSLRLFGQTRESPDEWRVLADEIAKLAPIAESHEFGVAELVPWDPAQRSWVVMRIGRRS